MKIHELVFVCLIYGVILFLPAALLVCSVWSVICVVLYYSGGARVDGSLVSYERIINTRGADSYKPVVRYTYAGQEYTVAAENVLFIRWYKGDQKLRLLVRPGKPDGAMVRTMPACLLPALFGGLVTALFGWFALWLWPGMPVAVRIAGIAFAVLLGVGCILLQWRSTKRKAGKQ